MKQRSGFLLFIGLLLWSALSITPVAAKGAPTFFTIEGVDIATAIPFVADIDPNLGITGIFDLDSKFDADPASLGDYYLIRGYSFLEDERSSGQRMFENMMSPLHYYPQEDGPGFIQYIGPENVFTEFDNHFFVLTNEMERQIQETLELARWYQMICSPQGAAAMFPAYC